jgi:class 3 adenylate cyclase/tetratricopeptide (TPR) repeat protein
MSRCPACGAVVPEGFAFCGRCGALLTAAPTWQGPERRVVTVLFCDLVGFTASSDRADPEDVFARLRPYHARLRREIEPFGGTVEKFIGDAVMAVFGAPTAHEDDAERAVRAGLRILEAMAELNTATPALELTVRIGITTGEAVVSLDARPELGEGIVTGDVVNTAARIQAVAPVGGLVVGEPTFRATRRVFDYQVLEPVRVKGKTDPVAIWRVVAPRRRPGVDVDPGTAIPLVGRDVELKLLEDLWERSQQEASVQLVTLTGEAGVGKSRLVREFRAVVHARPQRAAWRQGRCLPYGEGVTFWALGEVVKAQAGILESDDPAAAIRKLGQAVEPLVDDQAEREWLRSRLALLVGLVGVDSAETVAREEVFAAWRRFLEAMAAERPLVVVLEDLHWADPALLAFTGHLVESASGVALLVVCTTRPELYERAPQWPGQLPNATTISLTPLSNADTARLLASLLDQAVLPATTQATLLERTGGNPLYAEEVCRMLVERGAIQRHGRTVRLIEDADVVFPASIQALIAARLDTLAPQRKLLLQDAAVLGRVFWAGALCAMGERDRASVRAGLDELAIRELVRPTPGSSVQGEEQYAFWHVLTRDVAYSQLPRAARSRKHAAAAAWIERLAGARVADHAELLAHHYGQALAFVRAADPTERVDELEKCTRRFLVMAGDRTMALDVARANDYYQRALQLIPPGDPEQAQVLMKAAQAATDIGQLIEAEQACEKAIAAFHAHQDDRGRASTMLKLSSVFWRQGNMGRSQTVLLEAIELLSLAPPGVELAWAYARMAVRTTLAGDPDGALVWAEKACALSEALGAPEVQGPALQSRGTARCDRGDLDGLDDFRASLDLALTHGLAGQAAFSYNNLAEHLGRTEGPAVAFDTYRSGIELAARRGIVEAAMWMRAESSRPLFELGSWDELLRVSGQVIEWDHARGGRYVTALTEPLRARVLLYRGRLTGEVAVAEGLVARSREIGDLQVVLPAFVTAVLIRHNRGDLTGAGGLVEELVRTAFAAKGSQWDLIQHLPDLTWVCVAVDKVEPAQHLLERTMAAAARDHHCMVAARARLAEARANLEEASTLYDDAADRWARFGAVVEHGHALLGLGRCLARLGRAEAGQRLAEARATFARLDARWLVAETDRWLRRVSPGSGRRLPQKARPGRRMPSR